MSSSVAGTALCSAVTDDRGSASCSVLGSALQVLLGDGYTATFGGTADVAPASASTPIVR